jgi:hypothetical protein
MGLTGMGLLKTYKKSPVSSSQQAALQKALDARRVKHKLKIVRIRKDAERREAHRQAALDATAAEKVAAKAEVLRSGKVMNITLYNLDNGIVTECQRQRREMVEILDAFTQDMKDFVVTHIEFVQNTALEERYENARQKIFHEKGQHYGKEKLMFHGTAKKNVSLYNICN